MGDKMDEVHDNEDELANIHKDEQQEQLTLLYNVTANDLAFFKRQQIAVTNYALLLYAGIVGVSLQVELPCLPVVLCIASVGVAVGAWKWLWNLEMAIALRRSRLKMVRGKFSTVFNSCWRADEGKKNYGRSAFCPLLLVLVGGCVLSLLVLLYDNG